MSRKKLFVQVYHRLKSLTVDELVRREQKHAELEIESLKFKLSMKTNELKYYETMETYFESLKKENETIKSELENKKEMAKNIAKLQKNNAAMELEIEKLRQDNVRLIEDSVAVSMELSIIKEKDAKYKFVAKLEEEIHFLQMEKKDLKNQLEEKEAKNTRLVDELSEIKAILEANNVHRVMEDEFLVVKETNAQLQSQVDDLLEHQKHLAASLGVQKDKVAFYEYKESMRAKIGTIKDNCLVQLEEAIQSLTIE